MLNIRHIAIMFFVTISSANAVSFSGELKANKECPLYDSFNNEKQRTNMSMIVIKRLNLFIFCYIDCR